MVGQQFTVGLRGLLKPEVDDRARREAVSEIEDDLEEVEQLEPEVDNTELSGDLSAGAGGAFAGAVPGERGRPAPDLERGAAEGGGGGGVAAAAAGEVAGSALGGISKVGGMMKVALGGAVAAGILSGVNKAAQASPLMRSQVEMFSTAMSLFFRPVGDMMGRYFQPFALGALQMAHRFVEISDEEGLMVGVQYIAEETGERTMDLATDEEAGFGRVVGGLAGAGGGALAGAKAGGALGSFLGPAGTAAGVGIGAIGGGLLGSKIGGDIQETIGAEVDMSMPSLDDSIGENLGFAAGGFAGREVGEFVQTNLEADAEEARAALEEYSFPELPNLSNLSWPALPGLSGLSWPELPSLGSLTWPSLPSLSSLGWPRLPSLNTLDWPRLPSLRSLEWPRLPSLRSLDWPGLPNLSSMSWPALPDLSDLEWPSFPDLNITGGRTDGDGGGVLEVIGVGAEGGIVDQPTLSVIGEAGPEAVVPLDRMGSPLPRATGGGSGSGSVEVDLAPVENKIDDLIREVRASGGDVVLQVGEKELARAVDDSITKHESGTQVLR